MRIGQRVRVTSARNQNLIGRSGSVVATRKNGYSVGVELDYCEDGHTCGGEAVDGRSKWFNVTQVTIEGGESPQVETIKREETDMSVLKTLSNFAKKNLDASVKAFIQLGWMDSDLEITREGQDQLMSYLFETNKAELGKLAKEAIKEIKANEAK